MLSQFDVTPSPSKHFIDFHSYGRVEGFEVKDECGKLIGVLLDNYGYISEWSAEEYLNGEEGEAISKVAEAPEASRLGHLPEDGGEV